MPGLRTGLAFLLLVSAAGVSRAEDCALSRDLDAMTAAVAAQPSCKTAAKLADDCAFGASGDVALQGAVIKVCEQDFLSKLTNYRRASYLADRKSCVGRYSKMQGTLYISMAATCEARIARRYSAQARGEPFR
jgi:hypothetical protein